MIRQGLAVLTVAAALVTTSCSDDGPRSGQGADPSASPGSSGSPGSPATADGTIDGMFDVGGHSLYLHCEGTGSPAVVYLHGSIEDAAFPAHTSAAGFSKLLAPEQRVCTYDRRNVGSSDTVDAAQLPEDALSDMHTLLEVAEVAPPYVLVGASFGGMLAYLYANEHPDQVVGMVLLDAMFPDELSLEHLFAPEDTYEAFSEEDEATGLERISHFKVLTAGQGFIGREPRIPVTYLASDTEGYEDNDYGIPEYDRRILELQAAYVDRFAPGKLIRVDAPHFMEPAIPDQIAAEVEAVIELTG